ncbi:MAG: response regulator [Candidatus Eremiobacteraeota bacterium]|nr:response regulator [Candidatus Eremiobacteraeota bacterium]MCW5869923.1 response regulator [Candidatus Eremiobacteraeota bacterium]
MNVLLVDDSLTVRMDLSEAFEESGFEVRLCSDLGQAREALGRQHWDVIVLDVILPDGDGIDLLAEVRADLKESVVLLLSTETEVKSRVRGLRTGADEYVGKPYDRDYVVDRARQLVEARYPKTRDQRPLILLIDDSATARKTYKQALEEQRYRVLTAVTGEEGLRLTALYRPAALIVDGHLPGIDGCTVIRQLRLDEALRAIPCLLLTGSEISEQQSLEAGADAFLRKDDDLETVLARVGAAIRGVGEAGEITPSLLGPKRLLMINQQRNLLEALAGDGYDLIPARTPQEGLELLGLQRVDCILLTTAELELCRHIKASDLMRDIPLMVVTEREEAETTVACLAAGADDTIVRNSDLQLLRARLRAQLRRRQLESERRRVQQLEVAQRQAASQLAEARAVLIRQLEEKNRELEAFSYSVSHDLRAPLRAILGFSTTLQKDCAQAIGEKGNLLLSRILKSGQRMNLLIDDMLALARISTASLELRKCDLSDLCRQIVDDLRAAHPERHVEVIVENSLETVADLRMLKILLENLIGNAWKFTSRNPAARIEISSPSPELFLIRDNGAGFDLQSAEKLFTPFQRFHPSSQFEGTGVGLATVHRVISRHGGNIWAESNPDQGATFFFQLTPHRSSFTTRS